MGSFCTIFQGEYKESGVCFALLLQIEHQKLQKRNHSLQRNIQVGWDPTSQGSTVLSSLVLSAGS